MRREIEHGERIAIHAVLQAKLAFEVDGPHHVGGGGWRASLLPRVERLHLCAVAPPPSADQSFALQQRADRAGGRPPCIGLVLDQPIPQLYWPIERILLPQIGDSIRHRQRHPLRLGVRRMRAIGQPRVALRAKAVQDLVPRLLADSKLFADLHDPLAPIETGAHERKSFTHW